MFNPSYSSQLLLIQKGNVLPPSYAPNAVQSDGIDYLEGVEQSGNNLTSFIIAGWVRFTNGWLGLRYMFNDGSFTTSIADPPDSTSFPFAIQLTSSGTSSPVTMNFLCNRPSAIPNIYTVWHASNTSSLARNVWHHFIFSISTSLSTTQCYVNGVSNLTITNSNYGSGYSSSGFAGENTPILFGVYSHIDGAVISRAPMEIAEFYYKRNAYLDLSVASNREQFRTASGQPVQLPANGFVTPVGANADIYLYQAGNNYGLNSGTFGNLTLSGSLVSVAGPP